WRAIRGGRRDALGAELARQPAAGVEAVLLAGPQLGPAQARESLPDLVVDGADTPGVADDLGRCGPQGERSDARGVVPEPLVPGGRAPLVREPALRERVARPTEAGQPPRAHRPDLVR